jgi:hypothetical protein
MHGSRRKIPSKKYRPYIYDFKFLALLGAPYIYDISRLRVKPIEKEEISKLFWYQQKLCEAGRENKD